VEQRKRFCGFIVRGSFNTAYVMNARFVMAVRVRFSPDYDRIAALQQPLRRPDLSIGV
jgi:hypothetical protein